MNELKQLETQRDDEIEIDLGEIFHLLLNKLWVIILCFIVGGVIGFAGTKILVTPQYSASSMIYILPKTRSVTSLADIKMGSQLTSDFGILAKSRPVIEEVNKKVSGLSDSNNKIVVNCSQLSAATEEVTASAEQVHTLSEENLDVAKQVQNAVEKIHSTADDIKKFLH